MGSARDFKGSRREIALAVSDGPRTLYEIGKSVGRTSGSISRLVQRMTAEGLLDADHDPPVRGTLYSLPDSSRAALETAAEHLATPGLLVEQQRLLIAQGGDPLPTSRVLARASLTGAVSWAAEINGSGDFLIAFAIDATSLDLRALEGALEGAGCTCLATRVSDIVGGQRLRADASALLGRTEVSR